MIFERTTNYDINGRTVVLTGATGGLGTALSAALRDRGANLAVLDIDAAATAEQAAQLGGSRVARGWAVDVRDLESLETAMQEAADHFGHLDIVIAAAGVTDGWGPMLEATPDEWERTIDVNLNGVWRTFKAALPYIEEQRGHMMAISSMAAFIHAPVQGPYTASKAGIWALCDQLRLELSHRHVTVGSVHPAFFRSPLVEEIETHPTVRTVFHDFTGPFEFVELETVIADIIRGIERRAAHVLTPRIPPGVDLFPGVYQKIMERQYFSEDIVEAAFEQFDREQA